jgi:hypothetical protein
LDKRVVGRAGALIAAFLIALSSAPAVFADGEIGDMGDTDSITNLTLSGDQVMARVDYPKDCPTGLSCQIEVQFQYKCPEIYCTTYSGQTWKALPAPVNGVSTVKSICNGGNDTDNYWRLVYRVKFWASTTKTVEWWGEGEYVVTASGSGVYRTIAEGAFNVTGNAGLRAGTKIETVTKSVDYSPEVEVATSVGRRLVTC